MQYKNAPAIMLGLPNPLDPDKIINQVILILKYFSYKFMFGWETQYKWWSKIYAISYFEIDKTTINV